jgi:antitoxin ParD1/3/4
MAKSTTVSLSEHYESFIKNSILKGRFTNASEVVLAGLKLLEEEERKLSYLKMAVDEGLTSGVAEDFDPASELAALKRKRNNGKM